MIMERNNPDLIESPPRQRRRRRRQRTLQRPQWPLDVVACTRFHVREPYSGNIKQQTCSLLESFWRHDKLHLHYCSRRRPLKSRPASCIISPFVLLVACHLSIIKEAIASDNNLRQPQQELESSSSTIISTSRQLLSISTTTTDCIDQWHISIEAPSTCTNSHVFPPEWAHTSVRDQTFHNTPSECCQDVIFVAGTCDIINTCDPAKNYYAANNDDGASGQTTHDMEVGCTKTTWHMSTEVLYACTNDDVYPDAWNGSELAGQYLFSSATECCASSYPFQSCDLIDTCPTPPPTPPPTARPSRTREPKPTMNPTQKPTPTPEPTPYPTSTPPDWYVDRAISKCVMDCVDERNRPCGGLATTYEQTYPTAEKCCKSISWIPSDNCMATASPSKKETNPPTTLLGDADIGHTSAPTVHFDWYKERSTNRCIQDCEDVPGHACGGLAGQWATRYISVEECCASVPWKPFDTCQTTAAPVTSSPTSSFPPTITPRPTLRVDATPKPTRRGERKDRPTSSPSYKPTHQCPSPTWFLFKNGASATCINDTDYMDDIVIPSLASYMMFDSPEECCDSPFAGSNCQVIDVCNPVIRWYGDYSGGWDDGVCMSRVDLPVPKGRRTFDSQLECCLDAFLGQSSEACVSYLA
mmetsp:Transcript_30063/g.63745  ORF Transcript_30063/g.63745 Transcript_30063/m.63745 type:complete len:641 (+) Transcript_30063:85-2007(+)